MWDGADRRTGERMATAKELKSVEDTVNRRFNEQDKKLDRFETALFAENDDNEFGQKGIMPIMRRLDAHIDFVCKAATWVKHLILGLLAAGASVAAIGSSFGWW